MPEEVKRAHTSSEEENVGGYHGSGGSVARFVTPGGHPVDTSQPAFPVYHRKFANPAPLGLLAFAGTTFCLSFYNTSVRSIAHPNVVLGMALGYGGLAQLIAGVEEWACGNTFGATAFSSYGGFWLSFAALYIPQFQVVCEYLSPPPGSTSRPASAKLTRRAASYGSEAELASALGIYLTSWALITLIFLLASLRSSIALVGVFFFLHITFWLLAAGEFAGSTAAHKAGGIFGIITAFNAMYVAFAGLLTRDTSYFLLPVGDLSRSKRD